MFLYPITFSIDADWDWSLYVISFARKRRIIPILNTIQLSLTAVYRVQPNHLATNLLFDESKRRFGETRPKIVSKKSYLSILVNDEL